MMQQFPTGWLRPLVTGLLFILITLGLLEGVLRLTVDRGTLYRGLALYPDLNRKKFEHAFSARYADKPLSMATFDPHLGWDFDIEGDRIRGTSAHPLHSPPGRYRIVTIGDSFTYGTDVDVAESFAAHIEHTLCNTEVLNMGVPGYGIDQAALKYIAHGKAYAPEAVILGIFADDYERASVPFHAFSKPRVQLTGDGTYVLANQPVPPPRAELERIRHDEGSELFSLGLLRNLWMRLNTLIRGKDQALDRIDGGIAHLLKSLQSELRDNGTHLLIAQIPSGDRFTRPSSPWEQAISKRLNDLYETLDIPRIDLYDAFLAGHTPEYIVRNFYVRLDNGTTGHLSADGNAEAARTMIDALRSIDGHFPPDACSAQTRP